VGERDDSKESLACIWSTLLTESFEVRPERVVAFFSRSKLTEYTAILFVCVCIFLLSGIVNQEDRVRVRTNTKSRRSNMGTKMKKGILKPFRYISTMMGVHSNLAILVQLRRGMKLDLNLLHLFVYALALI
jgi:hypothetical protein